MRQARGKISRKLKITRADILVKLVHISFICKNGRYRDITIWNESICHMIVVLSLSSTTGSEQMHILYFIAVTSSTCFTKLLDGEQQVNKRV